MSKKNTASGRATEDTSRRKHGIKTPIEAFKERDLRIAELQAEQMPQHQCHARVRALKIAKFSRTYGQRGINIDSERIVMNWFVVFALTYLAVSLSIYAVGLILSKGAKSDQIDERSERK